MSALDLLSDRHNRRRGDLSPDDLIDTDSSDSIAKAEKDAARDAEQVLAELRSELEALLAATRVLAGKSKA